jgi:putative restriction endonuclease
MAIMIVVAVTDWDCFEHPRRRPNLDEINFWSLSLSGFQALHPGELYLFKPHKEDGDLTVGGGAFGWSEVSVPVAVAWEAFGAANGAGTSLGRE